ncbi:MAG TPA: DUF924 family protein [Luteimonas sp.]|nr:DUF924 family protein [Luteimonas sp.]
MHVTPADIVGFWREAGYAKWFARDDAFDAEFKRLCEAAHYAAARRELEAWMETAEGALALLLLLDQYPRNCFRRSGHAYATDPLARHYAARAVEAGFDRQVDETLRAFFYLPFEHSEDIADQERSVALSQDLGGEYLKYAVAHRDVIARFGRFPHRNRELGRESTLEEQAYLDAGGGFG